MKSDEWIIDQLKKQEESGLAELIDKYTGLLKSVIQKHLYALPACQEECLNDVLLAIWKNISQYDEQKSSFKNWICAIARYRSINLLKKYRRDLQNVQWEEHPGKEIGQADQPLSQELWEIELEELLAPLSEQDQKIFKDLAASDFSTAEIAERHHLSRGALYSRISRGRSTLRIFFQKKGDGYHER